MRIIRGSRHALMPAFTAVGMIGITMVAANFSQWALGAPVYQDELTLGLMLTAVGAAGAIPAWLAWERKDEPCVESN